MPARSMGRKWALMPTRDWENDRTLGTRSGRQSKQLQELVNNYYGQRRTFERSSFAKVSANTVRAANRRDGEGSRNISGISLVPPLYVQTVGIFRFDLSLMTGNSGKGFLDENGIRTNATMVIVCGSSGRACLSQKTGGQPPGRFIRSRPLKCRQESGETPIADFFGLPAYHPDSFFDQDFL